MARQKQNPKKRNRPASSSTEENHNAAKVRESEAQSKVKKQKKVKVETDDSGNESGNTTPSQGGSSRSILKERRDSDVSNSSKKNVKWDAKFVSSTKDGADGKNDEDERGSSGVRSDSESSEVSRGSAGSGKRKTRGARGEEGSKHRLFSAADDTPESGKQILTKLLGMDTDEFLKTYWERKPLIVKRKNKEFYAEVFNKKLLLDVVGTHHLQCRQNLTIVKYENNTRVNIEPASPYANKDEIQKHFKEGHTLQFFQPQRYSDALWKVNAGLEEFFGDLCGASAYLTPPGSQGLAPHHDDVEVFILQTEGKKHWKLYKPIDELAARHSEDLEIDEIGDPTHEFVLEQGDLLYFPRGTIHQAWTPKGVFSTHVTISTYQQQSWGDFMQVALPLVIKQVLEEDLDLRRGLPINFASYMGTATDIGTQIGRRNAADPEGKKTDAFVQQFKKLVNRLQTLVQDGHLHIAADEAALDFFANRLPPFSLAEKHDKSLGKSPLEDSTEFRLANHSGLRMVVDADEEGEPCVSLYYSVKNLRRFHMGAPGAASGNAPRMLPNPFMGLFPGMMMMGGGEEGEEDEDDDEEEGEEGEEEEQEEDEEEEVEEKESKRVSAKKGDKRSKKQDSEDEEEEEQAKPKKSGKKDSKKAEEEEDEEDEEEEDDEDDEDDETYEEDDGEDGVAGFPFGAGMGGGEPVKPKKVEFPFTAAPVLLQLFQAAHGEKYIPLAKLEGEEEIVRQVIMRLWSKSLLQVRSKEDK